MDLRKWEAVWGKCPELRPKLVHQHPPFTEHWEWWFDEASAALIRDRASEVLAENYGLYIVPIVSHANGFKKPWHYQLMGSDRQFEKFWSESMTDLGPDRTEALYLACCKVLEVEP